MGRNRILLQMDESECPQCNLPLSGFDDVKIVFLNERGVQVLCRSCSKVMISDATVGQKIRRDYSALYKSLTLTPMVESLKRC